MNAKTLQNKIKKLGGTAEIKSNNKLIGKLINYTIEYFGDDFFSATKDSFTIDLGSDYNSSGSVIYTKVKDLEKLI